MIRPNVHTCTNTSTPLPSPTAINRVMRVTLQTHTYTHVLKFMYFIRHCKIWKSQFRKIKSTDCDSSFDKAHALFIGSHICVPFRFFEEEKERKEKGNLIPNSCKPKMKLKFSYFLWNGENFVWGLGRWTLFCLGFGKHYAYTVHADEMLIYKLYACCRRVCVCNVYSV